MITVKNLFKNFGSIKAVDNISFSIKKGEVVTLLGPNGAGKTTLMRMITGYLSPSAGEIKIYGTDITKDRITALKNIGYVPENSPLYPDMTVYDYLLFMSKVHNLDDSTFAERYQYVVKQFDLSSVINQKIETLSKGFKHRTAISAILLNSPSILILDEPTEGLDPIQKHDFREFIKEYSKNSIIIVSTHIMEEVEAISTRVIMLDHGKLLKDIPASKLKSFSAKESMEEAFRNIAGKK